MENNTSLEQYAKEVARYVTFALSTIRDTAKTEYRLPLSSDAQTQALVLFGVLEKGHTEECYINSLHEFLMLSVATPNPKACENRWKDVLTCWLSVRGLKFATQFIGPEDYSQLIAKCQYALRCIYFYDAWCKRESYGETRLYGYAFNFHLLCL